MAGTPAPLLTADDESHGGGPLGTRTVPTHGSDFSQTLGLESASRTQQSLPGPQTRERETNARRSTLLSVRHFDERLRADPTREPERVSMHGSLGSFYKRDMKTGITCPKPRRWATTRTSGSEGHTVLCSVGDISSIWLLLCPPFSGFPDFHGNSYSFVLNRAVLSCKGLLTFLSTWVEGPDSTWSP